MHISNRWFIPVAVAAMAAISFGQVPTSWEPRGLGGGGAMFSPSFSPHETQEVYASSDMTDVFHSTNLGTNWEVVPFTELTGGRRARVQFTDDPDVLYCVTSADDVAMPAKSIDGGATWQSLQASYPGDEVFYLFADPTDANRLIASDWCSMYFSNDGGATFQSWLTNDCGGNGLHIAGVFFDGDKIYVGTQVGLYVSTNGGTSFSPSTATGLPGGLQIGRMAGAKEGGTVRLFALLTSGGIYGGYSEEDFFYSTQAVYTLDIGDVAWVAKHGGLPTGTDYGFSAIGTALNDIDTAYVAGQGEGSDLPSVYKSIDGGDSWTSVLHLTNNQNAETGWAGDGGDRGWGYGGGIVGFAVAPDDSSKAAFTDYGFLHLTTNGGTTWTQTYVNPADENPPGSRITQGKAYRTSGLEDTSAWQLHWFDADNVWACFTDIRAIRSTDGGASWAFNYTGHTQNTAYHVVEHPASGAAYLATSTVHDIYQSTYITDARIDSGDGGVLVSTNKGASWSLIKDFNHPVVWVALDPTEANTLYASVVHGSEGDVYVTRNLQNGSSATWSRLASPPRTHGHPFNILVLNDGAIVCTYSARYASGFTDSAGVFYSTTDGASWEDRSHVNMHYWVKDLVIDPHDTAQNTWYACVWGGWGGPFETNNDAGGLYKTTDRGMNWTRIWKSYRVSSCTVSPASPGVAFATTETEGLWYSTDFDAASPSFMRSGAYPFRQPERVIYNPFDASDIWVTSFGNGLRVGRTMASASNAWIIE